MLLEADELQPYLQYAFDHFSSDLDMPFDFVKASMLNNPIPRDFGGNILKLAINIMDVWHTQLNGMGIFEELSLMVASCIMLDAARHKTKGKSTMDTHIFSKRVQELLKVFSVNIIWSIVTMLSKTSVTATGPVK